MYEGKYVIIRSYDSGVHAGTLKSYDPSTRHAVITDTRRIHYWSGASSLSELSQKGVSRPNDCRFAGAIPEIMVANVIEIIPCSDAARENIAKVPEWTQH